MVRCDNLNPNNERERERDHEPLVVCRSVMPNQSHQCSHLMRCLMMMMARSLVRDRSRQRAHEQETRAASNDIEQQSSNQTKSDT